MCLQAWSKVADVGRTTVLSRSIVAAICWLVVVVMGRSSVIVVVGRVEPGPRLIRGDCRAGLLLGAEKSIQQRLARARLFLNVNVVRALVLGRRSELLALRDRELGHAIIVILHR